MQALSDDDDDDEFDASRYTASFGIDAGSDDNDEDDTADAVHANEITTEPQPASELPPVLIEEDDSAVRKPPQAESVQPAAKPALDPYFGPAVSSSANSIVAAVTQKQAEVAVAAASHTVPNNAAAQEASVEDNTDQRKRLLSEEDEEENRAASAAPSAAKARVKKGRAIPKAAQARRQQEPSHVPAVAVVDTTFLETLNVAVKNKKQKDLGLQLCDFKKLLTRWTPTRLEFELPLNITRETAPWAVEGANGRLRIPPVPLDFDVFYSHGLRKEADDMIKDAKENDIDLLRHCAAATITCLRVEENSTYSTLAFMRVGLVAPCADADAETIEAWTSFRDRAYRRDTDELCNYEILIVLNSTAFGVLKNDREATGMFFAESSHAVAQKGGRGSTANHYNQKFETLFQDCEFDDDFYIASKNAKTGKKRASNSRGGAGANESNKQKKSSTQPTIVAAISRDATTAPSEARGNESESGQSDDEEAEPQENVGGSAATSTTAMVISENLQVDGSQGFNSQRVHAGVYLLGPESNVTTFVRNGNVYATVFA